VARKSDQSIHATVAAPKPGEARGQPPAPDECLELLLDEAWQALAVAQMSGLRPERLEVFAHDLLQDAPGRIARRVLDGRQGHGVDGGGSRAKGRARRFRRRSSPDDTRDGSFCIWSVRRSRQFLRTDPSLLAGGHGSPRTQLVEQR
jgi:hypothetical protein